MGMSTPTRRKAFFRSWTTLSLLANLLATSVEELWLQEGWGVIVISEVFGIIVYRSLLFRSRTEIFCFIMDNREGDGEGEKR